MRVRFISHLSLTLVIADCGAILSACATGFFLRHIAGGELSLRQYLETMPWLIIFPLLYCILTVYPGTFLHRPEELKRLSSGTTVGFMGLVLFSFLGKEGHAYSRLAFLLSWAVALFFVPFFRWMVRNYCRKFSWWGLPCVLFGNPESLPELYRSMYATKSLGAIPTTLVLDHDDPVSDIAQCADIRIERLAIGTPSGLASLKAIAESLPEAYAVVNFSGATKATRQAWLDAIDKCFQKIIIIPDINFGGRVWIAAVRIGKLSGMLLRQNLLDPKRMVTKRFIDLILTLAGGIVIFPLLFFLGVAIKLDSTGPALFKHRRIGRGGKHFVVYKFRTMAENSTELLQKYLESSPKFRQEWEETQKLKNDPRITRVGRFLRKTSLDELPQLINVLKGDMSLVGPRPIVDNEIERYGKDYELYTRVRPGITGLWQTSGRNDISYAERVLLDRQYVCNWSVWLDILIIIRTIPEVLRCSGAY